MDLELVAGRWIEAADLADAPPVVVVSRPLAERWWSTPDEALGKEIDNGIRRRIVGVVEAGRLRGPQNDPPPVVFEPFAQRPTRSGFYVVGHTPGLANLAAQIRGVLRDVDPALALIDPQTIESAFGEALGPQKAGLQILGALGGLALALTLVGVYGVMAHSVGQRMSEMGLRVALGSSSAAVTRLVLRRSVKVATAGVLLGGGLSLLAGQVLSFLLVGVSPRDPMTLSSVTLLLFAAVLAASYLPARRASRVDPVRIMKGE
jgi:hypothetical protein